MGSFTSTAQDASTGEPYAGTNVDVAIVNPTQATVFPNGETPEEDEKEVAEILASLKEYHDNPNGFLRNLPVKYHHLKFNSQYTATFRDLARGRLRQTLRSTSQEDAVKALIDILQPPEGYKFDDYARRKWHHLIVDTFSLSEKIRMLAAFQAAVIYNETTADSPKAKELANGTRKSISRLDSLELQQEIVNDSIHSFVTYGHKLAQVPRTMRVTPLEKAVQKIVDVKLYLYEHIVKSYIEDSWTYATQPFRRNPDVRDHCSWPYLEEGNIPIEAWVRLCWTRPN